MRGEFDIADGRWDDYLKLPRPAGPDAPRLRRPSSSPRQFKQLDADNAALMLIRKTGREDHLLYMENENRPGANDDRPRGTFTPRGNQYYEIVDETLPAVTLAGRAPVVPAEAEPAPAKAGEPRRNRPRSP